MGEDLGARLLRAGLVTRAQLDEVRGRALAHEGAWVAALVELGLSEKAIAGFFVSAGFGPRMDSDDLEGADAAEVSRLPLGMARSLLALPVRASPAGLIVAMAAPSCAHALTEITRAVGSNVLPTVACVSDLQAALDRRGAPPSAAPPVEVRESDPPVLELVKLRPTRRTGEYASSTSGPARTHARAHLGPEKASEDPELFVPLVRPKPFVPNSERPPAPDEGAWRRPPPGRSARSEPSPGVPEPADDEASPLELTVRAAVSTGSAPEHAAPANGALEGAAEPASDAPTVEAGDDERSDDGATESSLEDALPEPERESVDIELEEDEADPVAEGAAGSDFVEVELDAEESAPPGEVALPEVILAASGPPGPESMSAAGQESWDLPSAGPKLDEARRQALRRSQPPPIGGTLAAIRRTDDRDEVVALACRGARAVCRTSVFLALRRTVLKGWDGAGGSLGKDALRNLWIPAGTPSMFRDVLARGDVYRGPPGTSAADGLFRATVGSRGGTVVVCPVEVQGKRVAVLAADDVRYGDAGAERIETLARAVGEAFTRIIVNAKQR